MTIRVLIAEDDPDMAELLAELAVEAGLTPQLAHDGEAALALLRQAPPDAMLTDLRLPAPDGHALLEAALAVEPEMPVVMITGYATVDDAVKAFRRGLYDLITKPFDTGQVLALLKRLAELLQHRQRLERLRRRLDQLEAAVVPPMMESAAAQRALRLAEQVAPLDLPVLINGETGTGKGVLARYIHDHSPRREAPFFALNCAAVADTLIESELFGHEKGAFTGATARKRGLLELADGGTLLLDEINSTSLELQAKLLQFVQERRLVRVGGERPITVDVRLVAASNEDLDDQVAAGRFRRDLLYRLNVFPVTLPPLRERSDDIPKLAEQFLVREARQLARPARQFSAEALAALRGYQWPGNIRELENIVQRAVVLAPGDTIGREHLPAELCTGGAAPVSATWPLSPDAPLAEVETFWIRQMVTRCDGNKTEAARRLGIDPSTLHRRLRGGRES